MSEKGGITYHACAGGMVLLTSVLGELEHSTLAIRASSDSNHILQSFIKQTESNVVHPVMIWSMASSL